MEYLKKKNYIDDTTYSIMYEKINFFIHFLSHGAYAKYLGTINGEKWVRITVTTTSKGKIKYDGKNTFRTTKIEGIEEDVYVACSMLFKVNEYDELSDCVTVDRRSYYEEKHRAFIGSQIDKLNEEGNIPIVNFEEFINNINMLLTLEELGINTEGFEEKKQEYIDNLENERNKSILYTREMKDKITFLKLFTKKTSDYINKSKIVNINPQKVSISESEL